MQRETLASARELAGRGRALNGAAKGHLTDHLAAVLAARYAQLLADWNGEPDAEFRRRLRGLQQVGQNIDVLRRGDHRVRRLEVHWDRLAQEKKNDFTRAMLLALDECRRYPEAAEAFRNAFDLLRKLRGSEEKLGWPEEKQ